MADALRRLTTAIARDDSNLDSIIAQFPLSVLPKEKADTLLALCVKQAMMVNNVHALRTIIAAFQSQRVLQDPLPAVTYVFLNPDLTPDMLKFVRSAYSERTVVDYFLDLVNMRDDLGALKCANAMLPFFPEITGEDWSTLYHLTDNVEDEEYENQLLREFFASHLRARAPVPKWMCIADLMNLPSLPVYPDYIPIPKDAIDLLLADLEHHKVGTKGTTAELREHLISQYCMSLAREKIDILKHIKAMPDFDDTEIFRTYGPVNTQYSVVGQDDAEHMCSRYGGCRMFTCTEFEVRDADGDTIDCMAIEEQAEVTDWFRKVCDVCGLEIRKAQHAVRMPLGNGGWQGCYCSFECLAKHVPDARTGVMVGRMREQLSVLGIYDN